jgi:peptidoglycan/xylan/chitin deacetylase (PgdA/CDA1 family)
MRPFMEIPGLRAARRVARRVRDRLGPQCLVLMYHRVAELDSDPWGLAVSPRHFAEHLEVLARQGRCLRMDELARAIAQRRLPRRAVAVTFDDGYADNLHNARPLLARHGLPATVYVASDYLGGQREFWWDELERLLLQPDVLPDSVALTIGGATHEWRLGPEPQAGMLERRHWRIPQPPPTARQALYHEIWQLLHPLPDAERQVLLHDLATRLGAPASVRGTHRALTNAELTALADGDLIEIGAHTMTHPSLCQHPPSLQREEIVGSRKALEALLGRPVTSFAYPHGDFARESVELVREAGFGSACTCKRDVVRPHTDPHRMPRNVALDWDGEEFARRLAAYWRGAQRSH